MFGEVESMLSAMRAALSGQSGQQVQDAELFLSVAQGLLQGQTPSQLSAGVEAAAVEPDGYVPVSIDIMAS